MDVWIGLVHVKPNPGNDLLGGAKGAFVPVLALANSETEFASFAVNFLDAYDFNVVEIDDVDILKKRLEYDSVDDELIRLAASLDEKNPVAMSSFETYLQE